ncbi:AraC family transcriptional regulator [Devosia chinhatensis]|uniref:HTH araC/xylS-type domain-containing protein n=1 Tax=Devosia chinhatensis TaxID=429727 RepID=A0A0F5FMY9_9HYPH|nr:AraC family transcriptional regulator [Devosia chinhatensis]KKB09940.1 hypothetical protein VE26_09005 [Devosia chinhatensis]
MLAQLLDHGHDIRVLGLPKAPVPLHCMAISTGYEQRRNEVYSWDGTQRGTAPFVIVQHTLVGEGRLDFSGVRHRLRPGDTMIVTLPHAHRYWLERGGEWEYFWLVLNGREALRLARDIIAAHGPVLRPDAAIVDRLAASCLTLLDKSMTSPGAASLSAYGAMVALYDHAFAAADRPEPDLSPALRRVIAHIENNIAEPLHVERLAGLAELSRAHFVRQFTAAMGMPPSRFVWLRRMERIERLLVATDLGIAAIATATGFAGPNYLAKAFRRHAGQAPLEYRTSARLSFD